MIDLKLATHKGNLLDIDRGAIVHQVNLRGVMGAGLAKQIRNKYPKVFAEYQLAIQRKELALGEAQFIQVGEDLWVCNVAGQSNYGRSKGACYTNYEALAIAFKRISAWQLCTKLPVYLPYGMGAGLAGGDWSIVERLILENLPSAAIVVYGTSESDRNDPS